MSTSPVELVSLVQNAGEVNLGNKCSVWRGQVLSHGNKTLEAYIKHIPARAVFVECIASQIGRSLGLSIPRPLLVLVEPVRLPQLELEKPTIMFGSEDTNYPSLQQFVSLEAVIKELKSWPRALQAGCFDEWIANADRHKGNILYQGNGNFSLIDHSHAVPNNHQPNQAIQHNSFLEIAAPSEKDELGLHRAFKEVKRELPEYLKLAQEDWLELTRSSIYCERDKANEIISFLKSRLDCISVLISQHLGDRQQDMYATSR